MKLLRFIILFVVISMPFILTANAQSSTPEKTIDAYYESVNDKDWETFISLYIESERSDFKEFLYNDENVKSNQGVHTVVHNTLASKYRFDLSSQEAIDMLKIYSPYWAFEEQYGDNMEVYLVCLDYQVKEQTKYYCDGFRFEMVFLTKENEEWRIFLVPTAGRAIIDYAYPHGTNPIADKVSYLLLIKERFSIWGNTYGEIYFYGGDKSDYLEHAIKNEYCPWTFSDVDENDWYGIYGNHSIQKAYELNIMTGLSDSIFAPHATITVAQAIKMAATVHKLYETGDGHFEQTSTWYQVYLDYALEKQLIAADLITDYMRPITRGEMAELILKSLPPEEFPPINRLSSISDILPNDPRLTSILTLYNAGVLLGNDSNLTFRPDDVMTRAEAATLIVRTVSLYDRKFIF